MEKLHFCILSFHIAIKRIPQNSTAASPVPQFVASLQNSATYSTVDSLVTWNLCIVQPLLMLSGQSAVEGLASILGSL